MGEAVTTQQFTQVLMSEEPFTTQDALFPTVGLKREEHTDRSQSTT